MAGRVDEVQLVDFSVVRRIRHAHGVCFDRDAALPLQVHRIEHLRLHLARRERTGQLEQAIGQSGLAMIDMGDDGEVADVGCVHRSEG